MALNLAPEQKEIAKSCFNKISSFQAELSGQQLHKVISEQCNTLLKLLPEDITVNQTMLSSLVKSKLFDEALKFLNAMPNSVKSNFGFEHAYVLHRSGNNKEALTVLRSLSQEEQAMIKSK